MKGHPRRPYLPSAPFVICSYAGLPGLLPLVGVHLLCGALFYQAVELCLDGLTTPYFHHAPFANFCASGEVVAIRTSSLVVNPNLPTHSASPSRISRMSFKPIFTSPDTLRRRALVLGLGPPCV